MTHLLLEIPEEGSAAYTNLSNVILLHDLKVKIISLDEKDIEEKAIKFRETFSNKPDLVYAGYKQALKDLL